jgi:membrane-associated phospholipid phosphatase
MAIGFCVLMSGEVLIRGACAQESTPSNGSPFAASSHLSSTTSSNISSRAGTNLAADSTSAAVTNSSVEKADFSESDFDNSLGMPLLTHLASDQLSIWTSPLQLRWDDATWLLPFAEGTAGLIATDRATSRALQNSPSRLDEYRSFSNYGLASFAAAGAGFYFMGALSHDDHKKETGFLAGEAMADTYAVDSVLAYSFGRNRPYQDEGRGEFFRGGTSFPSDHAALSWAAASVFAHEYPGPLTQLFAYGFATAISASRVADQEHFPSDVVVGSAVGWLIGREVYRKHHDPELGGDTVGPISGGDEGDDESRRDPRNMGSPFVALDSWVYPALDRLAGLGYLTTSFAGMKPWTRMECARLTEEAGEAIAGDQTDGGTGEEAAEIQARLEEQFGYEIDLLDGGRNFAVNLESVYTRVTSISGPALTDGFHFGQTVAYDFGRPFERGTNGQAGGSFSASAGPVTFYVRAEYQHAPSAPAPSAAVLDFIGVHDRIANPPDFPVLAIDRPRLLDAYLGVNLKNFEVLIGKQSLLWGPGSDGALMWSDNAEPVDMVRLVNPDPFHLPGVLRFIGPVRIDQFIGRMEDHTYIPRPFIYGQKISVKPFPSLELGFSRTTILGGKGGVPFTPGNFFGSYLGLRTQGSIPGDGRVDMDWTFYVPKLRNYAVFYGDWFADDDSFPAVNPPRSAYRSGLYITRFPGASKLDLHIEAASTESPGQEGGNVGDLNYWNFQYRDGYTNGGNLIGNTVGRSGQTYQGWLTYWLSGTNTIQLSYKSSLADQIFVPGGGVWQDVGVSGEIHSRSGVYVKTFAQYEHISHFPILFKGPQQNVAAMVEVGFSALGHEKGRDKKETQDAE